MPWFDFTAQSADGTLMTGRLESADHEHARTLLFNHRLNVTELSGSAEPPPRRAIGHEDFVFFNEQLASMAEAGIALDEGLQELARDIDSPRLRRLIEDIVADLRKGLSLDQALESRQAQFPVLYSRVIRAGTQTGQLPAILFNLSTHLRLWGETRRVLWEALSYPLLVVVLGLALLAMFFLQVVPNFRQIYTDFDTRLPAITQFVLDTSDRFPALLIGLLAILAILIGVWIGARHSATGRRIRELLVLKSPLVGSVHRASLVSRFLRSVALSVSSGLTMPDAVRLGAGATGNALLQEDGEEFASAVENGESAFVACQNSRIIPSTFGFALQIGSGRGGLQQTIEQLARAYEGRAIHQQAILRALLMPVLIIVLGGLFVFALLALFLPLVALINSVSGGF